jgi:plasmid stabilization system protein ParE
VKKEIKFSYDWYQSQADGLGEDFISELEASFKIITEFPETWPNFQTHFKRYSLSKFPFSVIYQKSDENLYVVAVMHHRRKPGYWEQRIK